uniref:Uncharacterized protein n=1 Tax=Romanomermis culicivorax TaxID=13658 RepID=A0A915HW58_ROMCU
MAAALMSISTQQQQQKLFMQRTADAAIPSKYGGGDDSDVEQTINRLKGYLTTSEDEQEDDSFGKHLQVSIQSGSLATTIVDMPKISPSNVVKNKSNNFSDESSSINLTLKNGSRNTNSSKSTTKKKRLKNVQENGGNSPLSPFAQNSLAPKYPEPPNRHPPLLPKTSCPVSAAVGRMYSPVNQGCAAYEETAVGKDSLGRHCRRRTMQAPSTNGRCSQSSCNRRSTN